MSNYTVSVKEETTQYIPVTFDLISSDLYARVPGDAWKLYWLLRRFVCRATQNHSLSGYFKKGWLAVSGYQGSWAERFGWSKSKVSRLLTVLAEEGLLFYSKKSETSGDPNVLILGGIKKVEDISIEIFFLEALVEKESVAQAEQGVASMQQGIAPVQTFNIEDLIDKTPIDLVSHKNATQTQDSEEDVFAEEPKRNPFWNLCSAVADVCGMDMAVNQGRLFRECKPLYNPDTVWDDITWIRDYYGAGRWWYGNTWQGKKNQRPTPKGIKETWKQWELDPVESDRQMPYFFRRLQEV